MRTIRDIFDEVRKGDEGKSEARRLLVTGKVSFNGESITDLTQEVDVQEGSVFKVGRIVFLRENKKWNKLSPIHDDVTYLAQLRDTEDEKIAPICLKIQHGTHDRMLMIGALGYGEKTAVEGQGFPIVIEQHEGKLRILVWSDINDEEYTHDISLEGAREDARGDDMAALAKALEGKSNYRGRRS